MKMIVIHSSNRVELRQRRPNGRTGPWRQVITLRPRVSLEYPHVDAG